MIENALRHILAMHMVECINYTDSIYIRHSLCVIEACCKIHLSVKAFMSITIEYARHT